MGVILMVLVLFMSMWAVAWLGKEKYGYSTAMVIPLLTGGLCAIVAFCVLVITLIGYLVREAHSVEDNARRATLSRMLYESYDPANLRDALDFNEKQKIASAQNQSFLTLCWTECYSVDTIAIPIKGYMPYQGIQVQVAP